MLTWVSRGLKTLLKTSTFSVRFVSTPGAWISIPTSVRLGNLGNTRAVAKITGNRPPNRNHIIKYLMTNNEVLTFHRLKAVAVSKSPEGLRLDPRCSIHKFKLFAHLDSHPTATAFIETYGVGQELTVQACTLQLIAFYLSSQVPNPDFHYRRPEKRILRACAITRRTPKRTPPTLQRYNTHFRL
jgi:hypothetical protein